MKKKIITAEKIRKIDKSNMLKALVDFPEQCADALRIARNVSLPSAYKHPYANIVFCGLGGSAIGADIIRSYVADLAAVPVQVVRDYVLPRYVSSRTLVVCSSYSGNTEETLAMYRAAKQRKARIIIVSSGGKISAYARRNHDVLITVPGGFQPRAALGYGLIPALVTLGKTGVIPDQVRAVRDSIRVAGKISRSMRPRTARSSGARIQGRTASVHNEAARIAGCCAGRVPVLYAAPRYTDTVAVRWRGQLAENAKTLASHHVYPEMNHNEIVGWVHPSNVLRNFIALRDKDDHPRVRARMNITEAILKKAGFPVCPVQSTGNTRLSRILSLVYVGDFVSFYLAVINGTDPTPIPRITYLKNELARRGGR